ncbi:unnamed protein product [Cylindrotheca closterium]|uniref:CRAL-TRIO domain-containing protein n=1 Tax=Cylindrotheca closterium TaxID=2856 RepID=A0AAD2G1T6_9STRA|nr:unnamed protein product [Cylindrotheca closterium]
MGILRSRKSLSSSQPSKSSALGTTTGVSVSSLSLLSGSFPLNYNDDGNVIQILSTVQVPFEMRSSTITVANEKPTMLQTCRVSSLSDVDDTAKEYEDEVENIDIASFAEHLNQQWQSDPQSMVQTASSRPLNLEDCKLVVQQMMADPKHLQRILIARKYDLQDSASLFFEQVRFRARWKPQEIKPKDIPNALPSGAWRLCGYTKEGCVVSNYKLQYWDPNAYGGANDGNKGKDSFDDGVDEYVRYVSFMLELMIHNMKPEPVPQKFCLIFDLKGFTPSLVFRKNVRAMIVKLIYVAQSQYPERLRKVMLVNSPLGFESAWRLIKPMLDEKTAAKVGFCAKLINLQEDMDISVLPIEYGGTHPEYLLPC